MPAPQDKHVAILRDSRPGERRVLMLPREIALFRDAGFRVAVETGAGEGAGVRDETYREHGAEIVSREQAWAQRYVIKYKAPEPAEFRFFHPDLHLCAYFHAEDSPDLTAALRRGGVTAYSLEFFEGPGRVHPMATADDEVAGKLAVLYGAYHLQSHVGGAGVLLAYVPGAPRPRVLIIGHGDVGGSAARMAAALGCEVVVLGRDGARLRKFAATVPPNVRCEINTPTLLSRELVDADLVIGAILVSTYDTPPMIERRHLASMKRGSMIIDVTCGYGDGRGFLPTCHCQTTHEDPVYVIDGVLHCKIDSLPSTVPGTASHATAANMAPHLIALGEAIYRGERDPLAESGKIVAGGDVLHPEVIRNLGLRERAAVEPSGEL